MPDKKTTEKKVIKKIGVMSYAKISTIVMAIIGLILGIFYAILGAAAKTLGGEATWMGSMGLLAIILTPLFYAIIGFVTGVIGSLIYNLIAGWVGGVEIEFEK